MLPVIQGLFAVLLPLFAILREQTGKPLRHPQFYVIGSFACCAWGIIAQLTTIRARFFAGDLGGIEDTINAVIILSVLLAAVTLILDFIALGITDRNK